MEASAMNEPEAGHARRVRERDDVVIVLLLLQSVVGLVGLLGLLVIGIAAGFPVITPAGAIVWPGSSCRSCSRRASRASPRRARRA
jgi:hypothetical protein